MRFHRIIKLFLFPFLVAALALGALGAEFSQADLEKMVRELESVANHNDKYTWPIVCKIEKNNRINAFATAIDKKDGKKPQATMVVFTGLVDHVKGDLKVIRAVVAHEVAHLAQGHCSPFAPAARDLSNLKTRQQEHDADITGAGFMQRLGYSKQDMVDMLLMLDKLKPRQGQPDWLGRLTGDHADPKARAAEVSDNPAVMRSLVLFDVALAYMDCRRFQVASDFFKQAAEMEPKLTEAYINSAYCQLYAYYDGLGRSIREKWFRPDFGPVLLETTLIGGRDDQITDVDRQRYKDALERLAKAKEKGPGHAMVAELEALAKVLNPDGDKATLLEGAQAFATMAGQKSDAGDKLRCAANAGVGFQRAEDLQRAYDTMIDAQKGSRLYNAALAENIGRITVKNRAKETSALAVDVMATWLGLTPQTSPYWNAVKANMDGVCKELGIESPKIETPPVFLCQVASIYHNNVECGMFMKQDLYEKAFGAPSLRLSFDKNYPDWMEVRWSNGDFGIFTERGVAMRVTSKVEGDYLLLRPKDRTLTGVFKISVGMTEEEFGKILNPKGGVTKPLAKGGQTEEWLYYPALNMGVLIADGKVKGITVTAVEDDE